MLSRPFTALPSERPIAPGKPQELRDKPRAKSKSHLKIFFMCRKDGPAKIPSQAVASAGIPALFNMD
jgi:hypothetical protein